MPTSSPETENSPQLRRALGLWDSILYGLIVIQPTAPMPVYGVMSRRSHGYAHLHDPVQQVRDEFLSRDPICLVVVFVAVFTFMNMQGIQTSARINSTLVAVMSVVIHESRGILFRTGR